MIHLRRVFLFPFCVVLLLAIFPSGAVQSASRSTKLTGSIQGTAAGTQVLAVYTNGASARGMISGTMFTVTLPKSSKSTVKVSLHLIAPDGQYGGPISFPKKSGSKTSWYGSVSVKKGKTTSIGLITYYPEQHYAAVKVSESSKSLSLAGALKGVSKNGRPAGAGRLGLAVSKKALSASLAPGDSIERTWGVTAFVSSEIDAGGDLDRDGLPNTLDIDDDGDGFPDQVDQSAGKSGSKPTSQYDAFSSLTTGIGNGQNAINYNFLSQKYSDPLVLRQQLSILDDASFSLNTRLVAPFVTESADLSIQDAWVDCSELAWCLTEDSGSGPRILPMGDGNITDYWKYAYLKTGQTSCNLYVPTSSPEGCQSVKWADFSMHKMLTDAKNNGGSMPAVAPTWADHSGGFGLYDAYRENPAGRGGNASGFDLSANIQPGGYDKFLDNFKAGDVITVKATLSDGSKAEISMVIAPFFVTAPTVISFSQNGGQEQVVDYVTDEVCSGLDQPGCRLGTESRRVEVSVTNPTITIKFWRPQRVRTSGLDDSIAGTKPFIDMGGLNYRLSGSKSGGGNQFVSCSNSAVEFSDTLNSIFSEVKADPQYSNSFDYLKDGSSDGAPSLDRYITAVVDFSQCKDLTVTSGESYTIRLDASGEELFGGSRTNANQNFYITFVP